LSWLLLLKTIFKHFILPPGDLVLLGLLGLLLLKRRPALARACLIASIGLLWLLSTPAVSDALTSWAERYPPVDLRNAADARAIIILGGGGAREFAPEYSGPAAEPYSLERLAYGAYLAKKTGLPVLVTGSAVEASAMHDTLLRNFAVETRWVDGQAHDTFQNAQNSARLLNADGVRKVILVTRATHMRRAVQEYIAAGFDVIPAPVGVLAPQDYRFIANLPDAEALLRSQLAIYEMLGEPVRAFLTATHFRRH
jgi:uncharacterized SAM-binding protein YcdF (DUF218 family)